MSDAAVVGVLDILERTNTPYVVVGSLACNVYTFPRSTQDADIVLQVDAAQLAAVLSEFKAFFHVDPQRQFETITGRAYHVIESRTTGFKVELFLLDDDPHNLARFARRRRLLIEGREAFVPSAEDVVIMKLRWWRLAKRNKDYDDARNVIASQQQHLDWVYISDWCNQHGTTDLLNEVRASCPPPLSPPTEG